MDYLNKKVKLFLKTGATAEGTVSSWDKDEVILKNQGNNILIIYQPKYNIIMTLILNEEKKSVEVEEVKAPVITKEFKPSDPKELKLEEPELDPDLRFKKLAELRKEQVLLEKEEIAKQLTSWKPHQAKEPGNPDYYGQPNYSQLRPQHSAPSQNQRSSHPNNNRMSRMQRKTSKTR